MRTISIGEKKIGIRATPLALLFYKQEFNTDLVGSLMKMQNIQEDPTQFDSVIFLQIIWAMAKANEYGVRPFPPFFEWVSELESFDCADSELLETVMTEAAEGFFRGGNKPSPVK